MPEEGGDGVVVLPAEPVPAAAGDDVDGVADVEEPGVCRVDGAVRPVGEPGLGESGEDRHVAQAAVRLLEVGLDGLGELAVPVVADLECLGELG